MTLGFLKELTVWKRSLLTITVIPIILIGFVLISYADAFDDVFVASQSSLDFFKTSKLIAIFNSDIVLPKVTKIIGLISAIALNILFIVWSILFSIASYVKLSLRKANMFVLLIELLFISLIYFTFFTKSSFFVFLIWLLSMIVNIGLFVLYTIYEFKSKK